MPVILLTSLWRINAHRMPFSAISRSLAKHQRTCPRILISRHPEVDWSGLAGVRDIVTHRYFRVDWNLLWTSIHEELPVLKDQIGKLMKEE